MCVCDSVYVLGMCVCVIVYVCVSVCVCVCLNVCKNGVKVFSFLYVATTYVGHMGGVWILYVAKPPWVLWDSLGVSGLKCLRAIVCVFSVC